ncbi:MAG: hypothetical protein HDS26_03875 [Bacteroides sp.]|nr:hypothetical protein [Bacteroides sp.]MBD5307245.1 hypothetical protein [Bacteroides sp.]
MRNELELLERHLEGLRLQMEDEMGPDDGERVMEYYDDDDRLRIIYRYEISRHHGFIADDDEDDGIAVSRLSFLPPCDVSAWRSEGDEERRVSPRALRWLEVELGRLFRDTLSEMDFD